ncbi:NAD(P)H-binding protein [Micromonospora sp. DR5-3]|uniref:NAD(P)-dependent oxidoreductase n=1 Tax=unclassified Micromonospora TaxID=2617518 RepID=UPI0011D69F32|nr:MULTISPECIES: NAD(P)H-binding protein [unclassified Micromonospora]MCW3818765.1 NAD(P)H-binding protein [Micromonospora sp. DR5-3]TYC21555.1 NAD(P)H-binding protein [Micromonospora sp. MP36]
MTTIAVIGATGRTGRLIVEHALAAGHRVTAVARHPDTLGPARDRLTVHAADMLTPGSLQGVLDDHDAVISAIGAADTRTTTIYSAGTTEIISALKPHGRLLVISSAGLSIPADATAGTRLASRILQRLMRHTYADMARMEERLATSDLTWTVVRPTRLTDRPGTGRLRTSLGATAKVGTQTTRADLADYLLAAIDDPQTHRTVVAVSS